MREIAVHVYDNSNLLIVPAVLPHARFGEPYSFSIAATGGIQPISFLIQLGLSLIHI